MSHKGLWRRILTVAGFATGIMAAAAWLFSAKIAADSEGDRLQINVAALSSGEFELSPRIVIRNARLKPGSPAARGVLEIRNQTGRTAMASLRAEPSVPDVGRTLHVLATIRGKPIFDGDLQDLENWADIPAAIGPGEDQKVDLTTRVKRSNRPIHGLSQDVTISIEVQRTNAK